MSAVVYVRIPDELKERLDERAEREGRTIASLVKQAIEGLLGPAWADEALIEVPISANTLFAEIRIIERRSPP